MVIIVASFYLVLKITNTSTVEARANGWLGSADPAPAWYNTWEYLDFSKVVWSALPSQLFQLLAMTFVVALSSSLDIAAIELELGEKLDFDNELLTVGASNLISGLTGGYTGSYIFSQAIFSLRSGVKDRVCGTVVALIEVSRMCDRKCGKRVCEAITPLLTHSCSLGADHNHRRPVPNRQLHTEDLLRVAFGDDLLRPHVRVALVRAEQNIGGRVRRRGYLIFVNYVLRSD